MKYKALILDLDGTTIPSHLEGKPSQKVKEAIKKAKEYVRVTIATGRPLWLCKHIVKELELEDPCVVDGGSQIINPKTGKIMFDRKLSMKTQEQILKICLPFGYKIVSSDNTIEEPNKAMKEVVKETGKLVLLEVAPDDTIKILEELTGVDDIAPHPTTSFTEGVFDIHITHKEATKKHGVEELIKILEIKKEETIGIGDNHNDMPLLTSVGFKVAMGQAPDELKKIADYVAPSVTEDGVAHVIDKFILNS